MKKKIIVIAGPTASGKTSLAIELAKAVNGEIISADSMQVYRGMSIATAAPTEQEQAQAPHHLVGVLDPDEPFSVARWCELARACIDGIISRGHIPIIAGGTGLFIDSLVDNLLFEETEVDEALRAELMQKDCDELYSELMRLDSTAAQEIHKNNKKRVVRALELYYSGVSKTQQNENSRREPSPYDALYLVLAFRDRQVLYGRINQRVDKMLEQGLEAEARRVLSQSQSTSAQAIGHKELLPYFEGKCTLEQACDKLRQETRHYAKRQITWFNKKQRENKYFIMTDELGFDETVRTAVSLSEEFLCPKKAD